MNTKVSYGSLPFAMIGGLGVVVNALLAKGRRGEAPVTLRKLPGVIEFSDSGIWGDSSLDPNLEPRVFRVSDFDGDFRLDYSSAPARAVTPDKLSQFQLQRGDILVVKSSGSANQVVSGRVAVFDTDSKQAFTASNFLLRLRPKADIDPHFLAFVLGSPPTREVVADSVKTMTYPNLSFRIYSTIEVPVIPLADQKLVGTFFKALLNKQLLPALPSYLAEQRRVVARIEELAAQIHEASILRQRATKEAEALRSAVRNAFFVSAAKQFGASRLEDLSSRITKGESPEWQGFTYQDTGPLFIRSENVLWGSLDPRNAVHIPSAFHEKLSRCQLHKDDVLINLVGASIGRACAVPADLGDANVNQAVGVISPNTDRMLPGFLVHFLLSPIAQDKIHGGKVETARPNISLGDVRDLEIPTPPLSEQRRIVAEVDASLAEVDALKRLQAETATELDALMPSILSKAFSGEF